MPRATVVRTLDERARIGQLFVVAVLAVGCIQPRPVPAAGDWITSDSSQYSPVAHFRAHTTLAGDGIRIVVDSASLYVPGIVVPDSPPLMSGLFLTAILAVQIGRASCRERV